MFGFETCRPKLAGAFLGALLLSVPANALTEQYETPPEQDPATLLDGKELGPGYAVLSPVRGDGFLRIYQVQTDLGVEQIEGDGMLKLRLHEIQVLIALDSLKNDASFVDGLKQAAMKPVEFVESTVTDPVGTAKNTVSGVGRMFGRLTKGVEAAVSGKGGSPAELAKSITGQAKARRELAVDVGVDPYTFYRPLSEKLDETASVTTAGNWTVSAITSLLPGGIIVNAARQADNFRNLIVDSTPTELQERTSSVLRAVGVPEVTNAKLMGNPFYTASEKAAIAYQMQAMPGVKDLYLIAERRPMPTAGILPIFSFVVSFSWKPTTARFRRWGTSSWCPASPSPCAVTASPPSSCLSIMWPGPRPWRRPSPPCTKASAPCPSRQRASTS